MKLNEHIFRANDIRGIAYEDLNEQVVSFLGRALGSEALSRDIKELIVGRGARVPTGTTRISRGVKPHSW